MRPCLAGLLLLIQPAWADTYKRQPEVDVVHYEIALQLTERSDTITGVTRVHVMMRQSGVSQMRLDFESMAVEALKVDGREVSFTHRNGQISLGLGRSYNEREIAVVEVRYRGTSGRQGLLIGKNKYGRNVYFAENWPDRAHHWFPCIDHPYDKATVEFSVTAPEKYDVVANGRLVETRSLLDGRKLTRWSESVPIPTYCMVTGAAEFSVTHATGAGIPLSYYTYPQDADAAARRFARTSSILEYFTDRIGPYPYEKLAQVQSTTKIGGMENCSAIFYAEQGFQQPNVSEDPVPHEIAHQWFGDSVTETDWDHLWISEGFATYFSALFYEHLGGAESMKRAMEQAAQAVRQYHRKHPAALIDPGQTDLMKKLNPFNYQKGAWILHMLRKTLGDEVFFKGIRRYYILYAGGNASTDDLRKVLESVSGTSLATFFRQWFYQPAWPDYRVSWRWDGAARLVEIRFHQAQTTGLFDMPLEIALSTAGGREVTTLRVHEQDQVVTIPSDHPPSSVEIDPGGWVLKSLQLVNEKP